jgi:DNA-binding NtrC family response regulator
MSEKVLFVDDDLNILEAYKRQLRRQFQIDTARGAEEGLSAISTGGPYAVVVSDLRMPGMDGNQFLARVKEIAPKSIRIMLTGYADLKTAMDAINRGNIFRLLTKPCAKEILAEALETAIEQYKINTLIQKNADATADRPRKTVLIVDDDPVIQRILTKSFMEHHELEVLTAGNGQEAINLLKSEEIDLVITDLYMPVVNGLQLLSFMSKHYPGMPAIVLTGRGTQEIEAKIKTLGDFLYFEKPLDINVLIEVLFKILYSSPAGQVHGISTSSFLQLIDMEERICTLTVRSDEKSGRLYFMKGELIAAETGSKRGEEAALEIISWDNSLIEIENVCKKNKREINKSLMHILMESARIKDEAKSGAGTICQE